MTNLNLTERVWSPYQNAIFDFAVNDIRNALIQAVAGSGKSTTMVECMRRMVQDAEDRTMNPEHPRYNPCLPETSSIFLAFNKSIAQELKDRGVNGKTFHALCYSPVLRALGASDVDMDKVRKLVDEALPDHRDAMMYAAFCRRMVGLAKQSGFYTHLFPNPTKEDWIDIATHHAIELEHEKADFDYAIKLCDWLLQANNHLRTCDFDDMLYFPILFNIRLPQFDFIVVDEAQDTNAIQRELLKKIMRPVTGRIIAVGDSGQAIYGFRGADSEAMNMIAKEFNCVQLPLTVSYRCAKNVVKYAQKWMPTIEWAENAPDGEVVKLDLKWTADDKTFNGKDLVICRTVKPLVQLAYRMIRNRFPVKILGKEIGKGLEILIKKMNATSIEELEVKLDEYCARETTKFIAKKQEAKAQAIEDKVSCITCLCDSMEEKDRSVEFLLNLINNLFTDKAESNITTLSSGHKAKGKEAQRVFWLNYDLPTPWAKLPWMKIQEDNIRYVIATRAIHSLFLITDGNTGAAKKGNKMFEQMLENMSAEKGINLNEDGFGEIS